MNPEDRKLGMDRRISRRDLLHGFGAAAAASFVPGQSFADEMLEMEKTGIYPPALTGMRGNHPGSFEVAHQAALQGKRDWGPFSEPDSEIYELVIVGAGISGLAAAHFYRKSNPDARILILDNHDDFGGHARRNEFDINGRTLIGYGGGQSLENPSSYDKPMKTLLRDLGVDISRFDSAYDQEFYKRHGLGAGVFFNRDDWGSNRLVRYDLGGMGSYIPFAANTLPPAEAVEHMPMSDAARAEMLHLLTVSEDRMQDIPLDEKEDYLYSITYRDFLSDHIGITEPEVFSAMQTLATDSGVGIETATAGDSLLYNSLPGLGATGIPYYDDDDPYIHHFPDGLASIARLLVRSMIPGVAPGSTMEDVVTAHFDYDKLDLADATVRLRLNSTVVHVENDGGPEAAKQVNVGYVQDGRSARVKARHCVLACNNAVIPYICPELPAAQREALAWQVRTPMIYTTVALHNWHAWKKLGLGGVVSPGSYHVFATLDFPVSLGDYQFANDSGDPITVHMERFAYRPVEGLSAREQFRLGRYELLATPFETIERSIRQQLSDILEGGGFDPARDIASITVNRWSHGYSFIYSGIGDPWYEDRNDERYPHVRARKPRGRIAIANADAGAADDIESAVGQAYRAVGELVG